MQSDIEGTSACFLSLPLKHLLPANLDMPGLQLKRDLCRNMAIKQIDASQVGNTTRQRTLRNSRLNTMSFWYLEYCCSRNMMI